MLSLTLRLIGSIKQLTNETLAPKFTNESFLADRGIQFLLALGFQ